MNEYIYSENEDLSLKVIILERTNSCFESMHLFFPKNGIFMTPKAVCEKLDGNKFFPYWICFSYYRRFKVLALS